jgi:hypothetical protein
MWEYFKILIRDQTKKRSEVIKVPPGDPVLSLSDIK